MKTIIPSEILRSDRIAIADNKGNKITYKALADKAEKLIHGLAERSLIFCLCDHQMETVEFLYEAIYLNQVLFLLENKADRETLERLMDVYGPQYIYCSKSYEPGESYDTVFELENHVLLKTGREGYPIHPDVALLLSTSGTAGSSKLVKLSYENLMDNAKHMCMHLHIKSGQKGITPMAIHYVYGLTFYLWHWYCGATMLVTDSLLMSREFQEFYVKEKANNFAATPFYYETLQRIDFWDSEKTEYLNSAVIGGARMSKKLQDELVFVLKDKFWTLYGQTECPIALAVNMGNKEIKYGSIGKPLNNIEIEVDRDTKELLVKGKSVCMGYANNREQLADGDENHGVLHTGDLVDLDDDGILYLRGRKSRYIKILAKRVGLDDVENYLSSRFSGVEFACVGTDDHLYIFYTGTKHKLDEEISVLLNRNMQIYPEFVFCRHIERMPRTRSGKIAYAGLMERKE